MKHLLSYFKPYFKESILAPLFKLLEAIFELLVPMVIAGIVDQSLPQKNQGHLWMQIGLLLIFAVIGVVVALIAQFYSAKAAVGFAKELTDDLYRHILSLPKDSRDRLTTSSLVTRLTSDTYQIQTGINQFLRLFLRAPIIVFGAIFMAYRISAELTFWFLVMVVILTIVIVWLSRLVNPLYSSLRKKRTNWFRKRASNYKACELFVLLIKKNESYIFFKLLTKSMLDYKKRQVSGLVY